MNTADNDNATTALSTWTARAWFEHIREYHPHRAANSYAKHAAEFSAEQRESFAVITAQVMCGRAFNSERHYFDMSSALTHLAQRSAARVARVAA